MKYIEIPQLTHLAQALSHEGPECTVHTRLEAYSCKNVKRDKKLFKSLETAYQDEMAHSAPSWLALEKEAQMTPFGPIDKHASRKTLYLLIATLNNAFPDFEFSDVKPAHFSKEQSGASVLNSLSTTFVAPHRAGSAVPRTYSAYPPTSSDFFPSSLPSSSSPYDRVKPSPLAPPPIISGTHPALYRTIDDAIGLEDCEVYSYSPDIDADPHANDIDDEDDDVLSLPDDDSSEEEERPMFEFDDYDVDESPFRTSSPASALSSSPPRIPINHSSLYSASSGGRLHKSALLWSSHWFFLNRKLKRVLFISVWARARGLSRSWEDGDHFDVRYHSLPSEKLKGERFFGWEGAHGAGARALGLVVGA
jgi:hypothetical protein